MTAEPTGGALSAALRSAKTFYGQETLSHNVVVGAAVWASGGSAYKNSSPSHLSHLLRCGERHGQFNQWRSSDPDDSGDVFFLRHSGGDGQGEWCGGWRGGLRQ